MECRRRTCSGINITNDSETFQSWTVDKPSWEPIHESPATKTHSRMSEGSQKASETFRTSSDSSREPSESSWMSSESFRTTPATVSTSILGDHCRCPIHFGSLVDPSDFLRSVGRRVPKVFQQYAKDMLSAERRKGVELFQSL